MLNVGNREKRCVVSNVRVEVDVIGLHARLVSWSVWVPAIHLELLYPGLSSRSWRCLGMADSLA